MSKSAWQLPPGVSRGTWDYAQAEHIARDYDEYFADCQLFEHDEGVARRFFQKPGVVADFGCGTGRALLPLMRQGHTGLAIDLSAEMLGVVREKAEQEGLPITLVRANLVECDSVADAVADYGICFFSTLGMIRGYENRLAALRHMHRILKPGGTLVIHVHNVWNNLYDPGGPWWLLKNMWQSARRDDLEFGDKYYPYRQIPQMFLHVFRLGEIRSAMMQSGFKMREIIPVAPETYKPLRMPWLFSNLRCSGWILVGQKS